MNRSEDVWAVAIGLLLIVAVALGWLGLPPAPLPWTTLPSVALPPNHAVTLLAVSALLIALTSLAAHASDGSGTRHALSALIMIVLSVVVRVFNAHSMVSLLGLPDVLLAFGAGLAIARMVGDDARFIPVLRPWLWLHIGVTLLGVEVLLPQMAALGVAGFALIALIAPVVIVSVWWIATRLFHVDAPAPVLMTATSAALGGVSGVIATAAALRPHPRELAAPLIVAACGSTLLMHALPWVASTLHMDPYIAAAIIGSTLDVDAAAQAVEAIADPRARTIALALSRIGQSMLGLVALMIAVYWVTTLMPERAMRPSTRTPAARPTQTRLQHVPLVVVGLLLTSALSSFVLWPLFGADAMQELIAHTHELRVWCLVFCAMCLGFELGGPRTPAVLGRFHTASLYALGLLLKLVLTLALAQLVLGDQALTRGTETSSDSVSPRSTAPREETLEDTRHR